MGHHCMDEINTYLPLDNILVNNDPNQLTKNDHHISTCASEAMLFDEAPLQLMSGNLKLVPD